MLRPLAIFCLCLALLPGATRALDLKVPGSAALTRELVEEAGSYRIPVGPFQSGAMRTLRVEGRIVQQAWRIEAQGMSTLQIFAPLRDQIVAAGFNILYDCAGQGCGGFDFRFNTRIMAAPDMFVDLFDYRFLSARRDGADEADGEYVSLIVSRSGTTGYVQVIQAGGARIDVTDGAVGLRPEPAVDQPLADGLLQEGHVILSDLDFETGSSSLSDGPYPSLEALANFLSADTARRVALVGHTDSVGALDANMALAQRRAASVLERLVARYGVTRTQLEAQGVGYLAPIAANRTEAGREANRRVEAVLLDTE